MEEIRMEKRTAERRQWGRSGRRLLYLLVLCLLFCGCGKKQVTPEETGESPETAAETVTETETEEPAPEAPFGVEGLSLEECKISEGLTKLGTLSLGARTAEGSYCLDSIYYMDDTYIVIRESVSEAYDYGDVPSDEGDAWTEGDPAGEEQEYYEEEYGWEYGEGCYRYTAAIKRVNYRTGEVMKTLELPDGEEFYYYEEHLPDRICVWNVENEKRTGILYDMELNLLGEIRVNSSTSGSWGPDDRFYTVEERKILRYSLDDGKEPIPSQGETVAISEDFAPDCLEGTLLGADGTLYLMVSGIGQDLRTYNGVIFDSETGEMVYLDYHGDGYYNIVGDTLCYNLLQGEESDYVVSAGGGLYRYHEAAEGYSGYLNIGDGLICFTVGEDGEDPRMTLELYDGTRGEPLGSVSFTGSSQGFLYNSNDPIRLAGQDAILLSINDGTEITFYRWDFRETPSSETRIFQVKEEPLPKVMVPDLENLWNPANLTPRPLDEELAELRERADRLEEDYGFTLYLGTEVLGIRGSYAMLDCSDPTTVRMALDVLEKELQKYPKDFFRQFHDEYVSGMDLYLTGTLRGTDESGLDYAGGFQCQEDRRIVVAMDCSESYSLSATFHHELSHAIETIICHKVDWANDVFGARWDELNPEDAEYTFDYGQFGAEEYLRYAYMENGFEYENSWYVDNYSLTYSTEDRARLWEYTMIDDSWVDCCESPHMKKKLEYLCELYREYLDLPEEKTYWEQRILG